VIPYLITNILKQASIILVHKVQQMDWSFPSKSISKYNLKKIKIATLCCCGVRGYSLSNPRSYEAYIGHY